MRNDRNLRGIIVNPKTRREIKFESGHERDAAYLLIASPDVVDVIEQPPAVPYVDSQGKQHWHTFDLAARLTSGERGAYPVKATSMVERSGIAEELNHIRDQGSAPWADRICLRTGEHMSRDAADNARLIADATRWKNAADVEVVREFARTLVGSIAIRTLTDATIPAAAGMQAVLCLLAEGFLNLSGTGLIEYSSHVQLWTKPTN
ncbi:hypothetical protein [Phyllobacterium sophorae]|uniref:TnsA endonuclease N-terminal domain-containing protein n=1 Tax=Phyllobacterium sophorae TaxID=1520277 RepID=A0A2P7BFR9_9HYPH|nr:hypothetical protein [Phyllobacterium sophorae]PSH65307.1 hypothetical protein CU103_09910 [Phyllobacterium sophorae]